MANSNPARAIRVDDELWAAVQAQAKADGITVTSIVINAFYDYLKGAQVASKDVIE
jgi:hypothetical protein